MINRNRASSILSVGLIMITAVLTACASSPANNYYVLTANVEARALSSAPISEPSELGLLPIELPEYLQRTQLAYSNAGNRLTVAKTERWSEPLDKAVQRVLSINLSRLDAQRTLVEYPWRNVKKPRATLKVQVRDMDRISEREARLIADWTLFDSSSRSVLSQARFERTLSMQRFNYQDLVKAYSVLLADLSQEVHSGLLQHYDK